MRKNKLLVALLAVAALAAAGCTQKTLRPDFGKSTEINLAAQPVNPNALDQAPATSTVDGQKAEKSIERYRADKPDASRGRLLSGMGGQSGGN